MTSMLSDLTLEPPTASRDRGLAARGGKGELVLSTMHSAKGLEWKAVFVIQVRDGSIPMVSGYGDEEDEEALDEELRLLYVAVTRAKDRLYVVWPREIARARYTWPMVSRFIERIPEEYFERREATGLFVQN